MKTSTSASSLRAISQFVLLALAAIATSAQIPAAQLYNVDFGQDQVGPFKTGPAAIGQTSGDFWNFYSRDDESGDWKTFGSLSNLKLADGTMTTVGLTINNAPGSWGTSSTDLMYFNYLYPFSGVATVTMTNLLAGSYDLYVYAYDGNFNLNAGGTDYGNKTSWDNAPSGTPVWQEGRQYVRYQGVGIGAGGDLILTIQPGIEGHAIISGIQLISVPEPSVFALLGATLFLKITGTRRLR